MADIQAGYYKGRALAGSEQYTVTSTGSDQIVIDVDVPDLGRQLSVFLSFHPNAAPYSIDKLRACGWSGDDLTNLAGIDKNEIDVSVKYETYNGKNSMRVDIMANGGRVKLENQMNEAQKRAFGAKMKAVLKGGVPATAAPKPVANGAQRARPAAAPVQNVDADDIPF